MHAIARISAESVRLSATGNSTELGGVVRESFVRSAWFPVAVNRIMECTPLHGSQLSQSDSGVSATGNSFVRVSGESNGERDEREKRTGSVRSS